MLVEILCINWISTIPLERSQTWRAPDQSGSFHGNSYFNTLICLLEYTTPTEHIYILLSKNFCFLISISASQIKYLYPHARQTLASCLSHTNRSKGIFTAYFSSACSRLQLTVPRRPSNVTYAPVFKICTAFFAPRITGKSRLSPTMPAWVLPPSASTISP